MLEQLDTQSKSGEEDQEKSQDRYAVGWPSRRISDCVQHFRSRKIYPFAGNNVYYKIKHI